MEAFVDFSQRYMHALFDVSHDTAHIMRVLDFAEQIMVSDEFKGSLTDEQRERVQRLVYLHETRDSKFEVPPELAAQLAELFALDPILETLVAHVSFSHEQKCPVRTHELCQKYPELRIVQDADRLDALGLAGLLRMAAYCNKINRPFTNIANHYDEKIVLIRGKTTHGDDLMDQRHATLAVLMDRLKNNEF